MACMCLFNCIPSTFSQCLININVLPMVSHVYNEANGVEETLRLRREWEFSWLVVEETLRLRRDWEFVERTLRECWISLNVLSGPHKWKSTHYPWLYIYRAFTGLEFVVRHVRTSWLKEGARSVFESDTKHKMCFLSTYTLNSGLQLNWKLKQASIASNYILANRENKLITVVTGIQLMSALKCLMAKEL